MLKLNKDSQKVVNILDSIHKNDGYGLYCLKNTEENKCNFSFEFLPDEVLNIFLCEKAYKEGICFCGLYK